MGYLNDGTTETLTVSVDLNGAAADGNAWTMVLAVSYTHLRAHETVLDLVCRLLLEKKKIKTVNAHTLVDTQL